MQIYLSFDFRPKLRAKIDDYLLITLINCHLQDNEDMVVRCAHIF